MKPKKDEHDRELLDRPGVYQSEASEQVGKLLWLVRGTRPDLGIAVSRIGRRVSRWDMLCDEYLVRIYKYLKYTQYLGLEYIFEKSEYESLVVLMRADADHAGDPISTRSTTGFLTHLRGRETRILLDWGVHLQSETAKSTPEAELVAFSDGTTRSSIPIISIMEELMRRCIRCTTGCDNSTAIHVVQTGYSRKMSYVKKYQKISIGLLHDWNQREENLVVKVPTARNPADVLTKPLDYTKFWGHIPHMGMAMVIAVEHEDLILENDVE